MVESEFKKLLEKYAECLIMEIWKPIENKIRAQIHDVDRSLTEYEHKLNLINKRQLRIRRELTKQMESIEKIMEEQNNKIDSQNHLNRNLESKVYKKVESDIKDAIYYGKKAEELYTTSYPDFKALVAQAKSQIKEECDLRIMDVLKLEKRYRDLVAGEKESPIIIK